MSSPRLVRRVPALLTLVLLCSCGGDGGTNVAVITSILVNPGSATLVSLGETVQLSATATTSGGQPPSGTTFAWTTSDASVATVSATGLVTAVANGAATISASVAGVTVTGAATVTVDQRAASIVLTPVEATLTAGETLQVTAAVADAGGSTVEEPGLTWRTSDAAVATVDATGLVTGVSDGAVTITATADGAAGNSSLTVIRADFTPSADATLGGTLAVGTMTIPAGVTVTLTGDTDIDAAGPVTIAGGLAGDCVAFSLTGRDAVAVSGSVSNACAALPSTAPPTLTIQGNGVVNLDGSTITSSGDMTIANVLPVAVAGPGRAGAARISRLMDPTLSMMGTTMSFDPPVAAGGQDATGEGGTNAGDEGNGQDGASISIRLGGSIMLDGTTLTVQDGGPGGNATGRVATAGKGGRGGLINLISADPGTPPSVIATQIQGANVVQAGRGGDGGVATGTSPPDPSGPNAPNVNAFGGGGGNGGFISKSGDFPELSGIDARSGDGGNGGAAIATAPDGVPADASRVAQAGGGALAQSGFGGDAGSAAGATRGTPGDAGDATATSGKGGDGADLPDRRDGAAGGTAIATGGHGGEDPGGSAKGQDGDASASGGNGGDGGDACGPGTLFSFTGLISLLSDLAGSNIYYLNVPQGGLSASLDANLVEVGGSGGSGGDLLANSLNGGGTATYSVGSGGNGGNGGAVNGAPGTAGSNPGPVATLVNPVFQDGQPGGSCPGAAAPLTVTVGPALAGAATRSITISGAAPWIEVTGTLLDDGTVSATGRGVVNFNPGILAEFAGTLDETAGTLTGTYTIDSEKIIDPLHPIVYQVDMSVPAAAASSGGG